MPPPESLPSGRLTFVFTDIEGSTVMFQRLGDRYRGVLADHYRLLRRAFTDHGGLEVRAIGDALFVVFQSPVDALEACADAQAAIANHPWPTGGRVRVRMGAHTGEGTVEDGDYVSLAVHQAARIAAAANGGQILVSSDTANDLAEIVISGVELADLGEFWLKDFPEPHRLWHVHVAGLPGEIKKPRAPSAAATNLPRPRTSFIGRDDDRQLLVKLLAEHRVVTVLGPGGVGKTRLSIEAAGELTVRFQHGVWLVELSAIADPKMIVPALATAMGVREQPGRELLDLIRETVDDHPVLMVFDNCEHVIDEAATVVDQLVSRCPGLVVLATSREPLRVAGEQQLRLEPLPLPDPETNTAHVATFSAAVRLFVERARLADPTFTLQDSNAAVATTICRRLDGIPLAIELAAARIGELDLATVAAGLEQRFELLSAGLRTAPARQQTLEASIAWSWDLLDDAAKACLRRISILPGGVTTETAREIAADLPGPRDVLPDSAVSGALGRLAARSLVTDEGERWRVLESIRAYALGRAGEASEIPALRYRLATWVARLGRRFSDAVRGHFDLAEVAAVADAELDNIRAAFHPDISLNIPEDTGIPLIMDYFTIRARTGEAAALVTPMAEAGNPEAIYRLAQFHTVMGQTNTALEWWERGREELAKRAEDHPLSRWEKRCGYHLTTVRARALAQSGQTEPAVDAARQAFVDYDDVLDDFDRVVLSGLTGALLLDQGRVDEAAEVLSEGVDRGSELGNVSFVLSNIANLALVRIRQERFDEAETLLTGLLKSRHEMGDRLGMATTLLNLGDLAARRGDKQRAAELVGDALTVAHESGRLPMIEVALRGIAELLVEIDPTKAAALLGACDRIMETIGGRPPPQAEEVRALEERLTSVLGETEFARARDEGKSFDPDEAVREAGAAAGRLRNGPEPTADHEPRT
jgi:predicted ATPase/class 3 adenylate cyclase/tetratricopeptide (TPR) repeat protein